MTVLRSATGSIFAHFRVSRDLESRGRRVGDLLAPLAHRQLVDPLRTQTQPLGRPLLAHRRGLLPVRSGPRSVPIPDWSPGDPGEAALGSPWPGSIDTMSDEAAQRIEADLAPKPKGVFAKHVDETGGESSEAAAEERKALRRDSA